MCAAVPTRYGRCRGGPYVCGINLVFLSALKLLGQLTEKGLLTMEEAEKSRTELERKLRPTLLFA